MTQRGLLARRKLRFDESDDENSSNINSERQSRETGNGGRVPPPPGGIALGPDAHIEMNAQNQRLLENFDVEFETDSNGLRLRPQSESRRYHWEKVWAGNAAEFYSRSVHRKDNRGAYEGLGPPKKRSRSDSEVQIVKSKSQPPGSPSIASFKKRQRSGDSKSYSQ